MKILFVFLIGIFSSTLAFAISESESRDAEPVVGYGYDGGTLVPILVDANGVLQLS